MIQILASVVVKLFPDSVEGPGDDEDVAEADEEVVKEAEGLVPALGQVHGPDRKPRPHGESQVTQIEAAECVEQEDEQDHEHGEPAVELHVEVDGANLVEEAGQDQGEPGEVVTENPEESE